MANFRYFAERNGQTVQLANVWHDGHASATASHFRGKLAETLGRLMVAERGPEMPADVAAMIGALYGLAECAGSTDPVVHAQWERKAATLIESLERQRQEAEARHAKTEKDACMWAERAEQAEKELADERGKLNTVRRCLADREELAQKDAARLAKLEAVVTALDEIANRRFANGTPPEAESLQDTARHALAALDRKEPKT